MHPMQRGDRNKQHGDAAMEISPLHPMPQRGLVTEMAVPVAARPQREEQENVCIFFLALLAIFW